MYKSPGENDFWQRAPGRIRTCATASGAPFLGVSDPARKLVIMPLTCGLAAIP
jgi:hypothetical protein